MLEGLKEIERLRAILSQLLVAAEAQRYNPTALRILVRQKCRQALLLDDRLAEHVANAPAPAVPTDITPIHRPGISSPPRPSLAAPAPPLSLPAPSPQARRPRRR
ncbi:MAG: hypothetical protein KIT14_14880 [bacterium]|nr:hypothetical protein [bacterium]